MEAVITHESIDYDKFIDRLTERLVNESLPIVQAEAMKVLRPHYVTGETETSIHVRPVSQTRQQKKWKCGEVYTNVEWAAILEFTAVPFMRLGARRARKLVRRLIKPIFGETMRGLTRLKRR